MSGALVSAARLRNDVLALATVVLPPERIAGRTWTGASSVVRVLHVAYQQRTHVHGRIAAVSGFSIDGWGVTGGGGGPIDSTSESVATVVVAEADGMERSIDLPADVAPREGTVMRLDQVGGQVFAVTNLSGRGRQRSILAPMDIFRSPGWGRFHTLSTVLLLVATFARSPFWMVIWGIVPGWAAWRAIVVSRSRRAMRSYMARIAEA